MMRPGGEISTRPLHFIWIADCSGSMSVKGKIQSLNSAVQEALPHMREIAEENPFAKIQIRSIKFSHGAHWHVKTPTNVEDFKWTDLEADELVYSSQNTTDIVFLLDTSGSMGNEIDTVKESCIGFANTIIKEGTNVRLGLVGFDIGGHKGNKSERNYSVHSLKKYTIGVWGLTSPEQFKTNIESLSLCLFGGYGCYLANEDTVDVFPHVVDVFDVDSKNERILVIISDEIGDSRGLKDITKLLKKGNITTHVMGVPGNSGAHEEIAKKTGGKFWDIIAGGGRHDFSILLDNVAGKIAQEMSKKLQDGSTSAGTDMGAAMKLLAEELKMPPMPERALPPIAVLIADGQPTDDFQTGLQDLMKLPWAKKAVRLAIAIGEDADMRPLQDFIGHDEIKPLKAKNSEQLTRFIRWLSTVVLKEVSNPASIIEGKKRFGDIPEFDSDQNEADQNPVW